MSWLLRRAITTQRGPTLTYRPKALALVLSCRWCFGQIRALLLRSQLMAQERIYIREAAILLNRRLATLRKWDQTGVLPEHLQPQRGHRNWRFWTPDQIEGIKEWIRDTKRHSGNAFPHYNPTEKQLDKAIEAMRRSPPSKNSESRPKPPK